MIRWPFSPYVYRRCWAQSGPQQGQLITVPIPAGWRVLAADERLVAGDWLYSPTHSEWIATPHFTWGVPARWGTCAIRRRS